MSDNLRRLPDVLQLMPRTRFPSALTILIAGALLIGACTPTPDDAQPNDMPTPSVAITSPSPKPAKVTKIRCRPPTPNASDTLTIYLLHKSATVFGKAVPVERAVPPDAHQTPLRAALEQLTRGTTQRERRAGCMSYFDSTKKKVLLEVALQEGLATINLRGDAMFALGATTATSHFYKQLTKTVFQFPNIDAIRLELDGSCEAFGEAVQSLRCDLITRD